MSNICNETAMVPCLRFWCIACKRFAVQTLLWSMEFAIHQKLKHDTLRSFKLGSKLRFLKFVMALFTKIVNGLNLYIIFANSSVRDVWQRPKCVHAFLFWICDALRDLVSFVNLKNKKNTLGGVLLLVLLKAKLLHGCFSRFLNCTNSTQFRNASHNNLPNKNC